MKKIFSLLCTLIIGGTTNAQISITASDMPVSGDTLRYSFANPATSGFSAADSGTAKVWDFSTLAAIGQGVDTFKTAMAVNVTYALTISPTAYGYKVADSLPGLGAVLPVSINQIYNFFNKKTSPSRYVVEGFAAMISGLPTPVNYSDEDEWYYFPLNYGNTDSSTFKLSFALPTLGSIKMTGSRKTRVDGYGTIQTPYLTTATNCIRVRSVIDEIDSVTVGTISMGLPRKTVEYKFLVNGEHYPAMWVTSNVIGSTETVSSVRYRDSKRTVAGIKNSQNIIAELSCYPNPTTNVLHLNIPTQWKNYSINLIDLKGQLLMSIHNQNNINTSHLATGNYFLQVISENNIGYTHFEKK